VRSCTIKTVTYKAVPPAKNRTIMLKRAC